MTVKTRKFFIYFIGFAFLAYGAVRLGVGSLLLLQAHGTLSIPDLQEGVQEVSNFLAMLSEQTIIPFTPIVYLIYMWVMGALLIVGAIGIFTHKTYGLKALYIFLALYVVLFINFQTINPKVIYLIVCALLVLLYKRLKKCEEDSH